MQFAGDLPTCEKDAFPGCKAIEEIILADGSCFRLDDNAYEMLKKRTYYTAERAVDALLTAGNDLSKTWPIYLRIVLDFFLRAESPQKAAEIKKSFSSIMTQLIEKGDAERVGALLRYPALYKRSQIEKLLESAIAYAQKSGSAEIQMLLMRCIDEQFGEKQTKFKL